jgi:hypothetical protein
MMKNNQNITMIILFIAIFVIGTPVSSYAGHTPEHATSLVAQPVEVATPADGASNEPPSNGKGAAKGCATGAAIGTAFAPGAGTLAGCIIAGIWGWFW